MDKATEERIKQLQAIEQNMQAYGIQKQTIQGQLLEAESAVKEIGDSKEVFRIVGNIMVKANPDVLKEELKEKITVLRSRFDTIDKQEERLRKEADSIQKVVMKEMKQ